MAFNADAGAIQTFIQDMKDFHQNIVGQVNYARGHAEQLAGPSFQGGAGTALQNSFARFLDAATKMNDSLLLNAENLEQVKKKFGTVEDEQLGNLQQTGGLLDFKA
ncbi:WXG100 family type VII secretion target [Nocardia wallacei]|uniref:WXG100 family type VII secretion target n=1 Tax=Nocardia wallacei TaxID=480035 RepID=UPI0024579D14|nr:WXG100 family type VII secretion target [Nocardia wallacei]